MALPAISAATELCLKGRDWAIKDMGKLLSAIAISCILFCGAALGQTDGRSVYLSKCSACHARDGSGNGTIGRSLGLSDIRPTIKRMTDEQLRRIILEGRGKMPPAKKLGDAKLSGLTLFLRDLTAGNPDNGRVASQVQAQPLPEVPKVYQAKCSACHAQDGTGRTSIGKSLRVPDLTSTAVQGQSVQELAEIISKGKGRMPAYAKTFNQVQVGQFVSYIRGLARRGSVREPVASPKPSASGSQPPSLPTRMAAQPELPSPAPRPAGRTALEKPPEVEKPNSATAPPARNARQIYMAKCSACHSRDGSGSGTIGKNMRIPSLTSPQVEAQSDENLAGVISNGAGKMPAYKKKYSPEEIELLVAYIRDLAKKSHRE